MIAIGEMLKKLVERDIKHESTILKACNNWLIKKSNSMNDGTYIPEMFFKITDIGSLEPTLPKNYKYTIDDQLDILITAFQASLAFDNDKCNTIKTPTHKEIYDVIIANPNTHFKIGSHVVKEEVFCTGFIRAFKRAFGIIVPISIEAMTYFQSYGPIISVDKINLFKELYERKNHHNCSKDQHESI